MSDKIENEVNKALKLATILGSESGNSMDRVRPETLLEVAAEYSRAIKLHGHFHSLHDGYGVMAEEFDEFWDEIKMRKPSRAALKEEAIQLAAMCCKFVDQFCRDDIRKGHESAAYDPNNKGDRP